VEKAFSKMTKALGTEKEGAAALVFAKTMNRIYENDGFKKVLKDTDIDKEKRLVLLRAYYDIVRVQKRLMADVDYLVTLWRKYDDDYRALGGSWYENEAYRTGKTKEEVIAEDHAEGERIKKQQADHKKELGL
jgi:hypothetical protein